MSASLIQRAVSRQLDFERWLLDITSIPTAAGREDRVIEWILAWARRRKSRMTIVADSAGNLLLRQAPATEARGAKPARRPLLITAHLDHPAFVVRHVIDKALVELEFRGGVHDPYFEGASIELFDRADSSRRGVIESLDGTAKPYKRVQVRMRGGTAGFDVGDVGRWALPKAKITKHHGTRVVETHACDDLAAVAAALSAFDLLAGEPGCEHVGVLFTVAEEVGFIGAIATARQGGLPRDARLLCLENSRSFADSPIGGGAILRVGDRISVFSPELTNQLGQLYLEHQKRTVQEGKRSFTFQRKLMAGGACEATAFSAYGYESTCLCLPLGNYHNMQAIDEVLAGARPAKIGPEFVAIDDYHTLIEMLLVAASGLDDEKFQPLRDRMETIFAENKHVVAALAGE